MREIANLREHLVMIARAIDASPHRAIGAIVRHHADDLGISPQTLYRKLKGEIAWESGRKTRADKGTTCAADDALEFASALQRTSVRKNSKLVLHAPMAAALTRQSGFILGVGADRMQALLRERGLDAASQARPLPHVEMKSRPNQCHQLDPSLCLIYYTPGGEQRIVRDDESYKNKPDFWKGVKFKVWRYVLTDHASHWICVHYFEAHGESMDCVFKFLMYAWAKREGRTFHGVPLFLMMDQGSANKNNAIKNVCDGLEVKLLFNLPGQPRAKGGVEVAQNIVETHFESLLRFQPVKSVAELNAAAEAWCNVYNSNMIPGLDTRLHRSNLAQPIARNALWMLIRANELRLCPAVAVCAALMRGASATRKVSNSLCITYRHPAAPQVRKYDLRNFREIRSGVEVTIRPLVYSEEAVIISFEHWNGAKLEYRVEPLRDFDEFGRRLDAPSIGEEYKALPVHDAERQSEALDALAYGVDADGVIRDADEIAREKAKAKAQPFAHLNEGQGLRPLDALLGIKTPTYLPKKGSEIIPKTEPLQPPRSTAMEDVGLALNVPDHMSVPMQRLNTIEIAKEMMRRLGALWDPEKFSLLVEWYPDGCSEEDLPAIAEEIKRRSRMQIVK